MTRLVRCVSSDDIAAAQVAARAAEALRESRRARQQHPVYAPTWTGLHGVAGRFGAVSALPVVGSNSPTIRTETVPGLSAGGSSGSVLQNLRAKQTGQPGATTASASSLSTMLATKIREFLSARKGEAASGAIVGHFKRMVAPADMGVFKGVLLQVARLDKSRGVWSLRSD